jgi:hypothetical protein
MDTNLQGKISVANAGIDYLTFTMKNDNPDITATQLRFVELMTEACEAGDESKVSSPQGYGGYATKHLFYGVRRDGWMFRASGEIADQVAKEVIYAKTEIRPTRIDFQTTIITERPLRGFAGEIRTIVRDAGEAGGRQNRISTNLFEAPNGADSVGVGSRRSTRYLRVYNKSAEQQWKIEGNQYRYELEVKKGQAVGCWEMVKSAANVRYLAMSLVAGALLAKGVPVPWDEGCKPLDLPSTYNPTDEERRYKWLIEQVAPVARTIEDPDRIACLRLAFGF